MEKNAPGEEKGDFRTRGIRVRVYMRMYMQRCGSPYMSRAFFFSLCFSFFLSLDANFKKKPEIVYSSCFFFFIKKFIY